MYKPQFSLNFKIVNHLSTIERLYGILTSEELIPSLSLDLSNENKILATHYSTSIEGNPLSKMDVTNIILGDVVPVTKSQREVTNYFKTLNRLFTLARNHRDLSIPFVSDLHKSLMDKILKKGAGEIRNGGVFVGHANREEGLVVKHNPPFHTRSEIEHALRELFKYIQKQDDIHPLIKGGILHHEVAYIHPFLDGNGRIARLLTAYYLLLKNYEIIKYFIIDDYYDVDRFLYSDSLHSADSGDKTAWLEYFLEGIAYSLQAAQARVELLKDRTGKILGEKRVLVSNREEEALRIIIDRKAIKTSDIQNALSVSRQQAHNLLSSLVKKGVLTKYGSTKLSYYKLKKDKT